MGDNNPTQTTGPTNNVQNVSHPSTQQPISPPKQKQTLNIHPKYWPSSPSQPQKEVVVPQEKPAQKIPSQEQQTPVAQTSPPKQQQAINIHSKQPSAPSQPPPNGNYPQNRRTNESTGKCLYIIYEIARVVQILVSFILISYLFSTLIIFLFADQEWDWRFLPFWPEEEAAAFTFINLIFWLGLFSSPFGLIGAVCEVLCCQVIYTIMVIILIPYCAVPVFVLIGISNKWYKLRGTLCQPRRYWN